MLIPLDDESEGVGLLRLGHPQLFQGNRLNAVAARLPTVCVSFQDTSSSSDVCAKSALPMQTACPEPTVWLDTARVYTLQSYQMSIEAAL